MSQQQSTGTGRLLRVPMPRFGRPRQSKERCGLSRSKLYEVAGEYKGVFLKLNGSTIVDYNKVDKILAKLPKAEINMKLAKIKTKTK